MPTYEYRCAKCGRHLEVFQSFSEAPLTVHDDCGGALARVLSPAGIVLKGSGFYKTDSRDSKRSSSRRSDRSDRSDRSGSAPGTSSGAAGDTSSPATPSTGNAGGAASSSEGSAA